MKNKPISIKEAVAKFSGKFISVDSDGHTYNGPCEFIGVNTNIGWLQVTVGRAPIKLKSLSQVKLYNGFYNNIEYINGVKKKG